MVIKLIIIIIIGLCLFFVFEDCFLIFTDLYLRAHFHRALPAKIFFTKDYVKRHPEIEGTCINYRDVLKIFMAD